MSNSGSLNPSATELKKSKPSSRNRSATLSFTETSSRHCKDRTSSVLGGRSTSRSGNDSNRTNKSGNHLTKRSHAKVRVQPPELEVLFEDDTSNTTTKQRKRKRAKQRERENRAIVTKKSKVTKQLHSEKARSRKSAQGSTSLGRKSKKMDSNDSIDFSFIDRWHAQQTSLTTPKRTKKPSKALRNERELTVELEEDVFANADKIPHDDGHVHFHDSQGVWEEPTEENYTSKERVAKKIRSKAPLVEPAVSSRENSAFGHNQQPQHAEQQQLPSKQLGILKISSSRDTHLCLETSMDVFNKVSSPQARERIDTIARRLKEKSGFVPVIASVYGNNGNFSVFDAPKPKSYDQVLYELEVGGYIPLEDPAVWENLNRRKNESCNMIDSTAEPNTMCRDAKAALAKKGYYHYIQHFPWPLSILRQRCHQTEPTALSLRFPAPLLNLDDLGLRERGIVEELSFFEFDVKFHHIDSNSYFDLCEAFTVARHQILEERSGIAKHQNIPLRRETRWPRHTFEKLRKRKKYSGITTDEFLEAVDSNYKEEATTSRQKDLANYQKRINELSVKTTRDSNTSDAWVGSKSIHSQIDDSDQPVRSTALERENSDIDEDVFAYNGSESPEINSNVGAEQPTALKSLIHQISSEFLLRNDRNKQHSLDDPALEQEDETENSRSPSPTYVPARFRSRLPTIEPGESSVPQRSSRDTQDLENIFPEIESRQEWSSEQHDYLTDKLWSLARGRTIPPTPDQRSSLSNSDEAEYSRELSAVLSDLSFEGGHDEIVRDGHDEKIDKSATSASPHPPSPPNPITFSSTTRTTNIEEMSPNSDVTFAYYSTSKPRTPLPSVSRKQKSPRSASTFSPNALQQPQKSPATPGSMSRISIPVNSVPRILSQEGRLNIAGIIGTKSSPSTTRPETAKSIFKSPLAGNRPRRKILSRVSIGEGGAATAISVSPAVEKQQDQQHKSEDSLQKQQQESPANKGEGDGKVDAPQSPVSQQMEITAPRSARRRLLIFESPASSASQTDTAPITKKARRSVVGSRSRRQLNTVESSSESSLLEDLTDAQKEHVKAGAGGEGDVDEKAGKSNGETGFSNTATTTARQSTDQTHLSSHRGRYIDELGEIYLDDSVGTVPARKELHHDTESSSRNHVAYGDLIPRHAQEGSTRDSPITVLPPPAAAKEHGQADASKDHFTVPLLEQAENENDITAPHRKDSSPDAQNKGATTATEADMVEHSNLNQSVAKAEARQGLPSQKAETAAAEKMPSPSMSSYSAILAASAFIPNSVPENGNHDTAEKDVAKHSDLIQTVPTTASSSSNNPQTPSGRPGVQRQPESGHTLLPRMNISMVSTSFTPLNAATERSSLLHSSGGKKASELGRPKSGVSAGTRTVSNSSKTNDKESNLDAEFFSFAAGTNGSQGPDNWSQFGQMSKNLHFNLQEDIQKEDGEEEEAQGITRASTIGTSRPQSTDSNSSNRSSISGLLPFRDPNADARPTRTYRRKRNKRW